MKTEFTPSITCQGNRVDVKSRNLPPPYANRGKRGTIKEFSPQSRFRMLRMIAIVDWHNLPDGAFVTLTYPDDRIPRETEVATSQRHHFLRWVERRAGSQCLGIWRHEFIDRKTGQFVGRTVGHWHISIFGQRLPGKDEVREEWARELKSAGYVDVDVKEMSNAEHAAFYVAKYCTEQKSYQELGNYTYLTKPGRQWGLHRKDAFPWQEQFKALDCGDEIFAAMLRIAKEVRGNSPLVNDHNFTLLGEKAKEFISLCGEFFY